MNIEIEDCPLRMAAAAAVAFRDGCEHVSQLMADGIDGFRITRQGEWVSADYHGITSNSGRKFSLQINRDYLRAWLKINGFKNVDNRASFVAAIIENLKGQHAKTN